MGSKRYDYVIAVAECGSFSAAAKRLFISQSSLSQYVKNLEIALGVTLFDRDTRPLQLTAAGQRYLSTAYRVSRLETQLQGDLTMLQPVLTTTLRLAVTRYWGALILPRVLPAFQRRFAKVHIKIVEGRTRELMAALTEGRVDLAFLTAPETLEAGLACVPLLQEAITVAVQPECLPPAVAEQRVLTPEMLQTVPFILLHRGQKLRQIAEEVFTRGLPPVLMTTENITTAYKLASTGLAATFVPERIANLTPPLRPIPHYALQTPVHWQLDAVYPKALAARPDISALVRLAEQGW
ncbi:MAG: LysR family transcriptional regulator [Lactobacillus sp.]|jgi:DNA-binding transcriptional LysR family regulator|nr:LysR family transcriptional regulator [Lactobacillus sp.]MCI2034205.1 LysR family transcriptional regulator [Lactobacillus sp.]